MKGSIRQRTPGSYELTIDIEPHRAHQARPFARPRNGGSRFRRPPRQRRSRAAASLGKHQRQESRLRRPALRAESHGERHRQHDAASDHRHPDGAWNRRRPHDRRRGGRGCGECVQAGIDMDGVTAFADSYDMLMRDIETASGKLAVE